MTGAVGLGAKEEEYDQIKKILLGHDKELELWHMGDMEPVKNFRQERDKDRDTVERAL